MSEARIRKLTNLDSAHLALDDRAIAVFGEDSALVQRAIEKAATLCRWSQRMSVTEATRGRNSLIFHQFDLIRYQNSEGHEVFTIASGRKSDDHIC